MSIPEKRADASESFTWAAALGHSSKFASSDYKGSRRNNYSNTLSAFGVSDGDEVNRTRESQGADRPWRSGLYYYISCGRLLHFKITIHLPLGPGRIITPFIYNEKISDNLGSTPYIV